MTPTHAGAEQMEALLVDDAIGIATYRSEATR